MEQQSKSGLSHLVFWLLDRIQLATHSREQSSERMISSSHSPATFKTHKTTGYKHPCSQRDSNSQPHQSNDCKHILYPVQSTGCVLAVVTPAFYKPVDSEYGHNSVPLNYIYIYSKTCLKRNTIVLVFFSVFTGFRFTKGCGLIKQSTKNMIA